MEPYLILSCCHPTVHSQSRNKKERLSFPNKYGNKENRGKAEKRGE